ncbi:hypothetical protein AAES_159280 [Amazona aestiva]|uniref:Cadherin N-terminal domain-containing protein n=1 Tax=Amazona aestiva TaxID=12930 RepID=A0A0Q3UQ43_AMAAE|nr:hypothetical protein AAES_159280 [Amazona aestiva]
MSSEAGHLGRRDPALLWAVLVIAWDAAWGQLRYSVPEELPKGSFVGDVANDLGLELPALRDRGIRVASEGRMQYFALHGKTGHLVTAERIDREQLCEGVQQCVLRCESKESESLAWNTGGSTCLLPGAKACATHDMMLVLCPERKWKSSDKTSFA